MSEKTIGTIVFGYSGAVGMALSIGWAGKNDQILLPCTGSSAWPLEILLRESVPVPYDAPWPELSPAPEAISCKTGNRTRLIVVLCPPGETLRKIFDLSTSRDIPLVCEFSSLSMKHLEQFLDLSDHAGADNLIALVPLGRVPGPDGPIPVPPEAAWLVLTIGKPSARHRHLTQEKNHGFFHGHDSHPETPAGEQSGPLPFAAGIFEFPTPDGAVEFVNEYGNFHHWPSRDEGEGVKNAGTKGLEILDNYSHIFPEPGISLGGFRFTSQWPPAFHSGTDWRTARAVPYYGWPVIARRLRLTRKDFPLLAADEGRMWHASR